MAPAPPDKPRLRPVLFFDFADVLFAWNGQTWQARDVYTLLYQHSERYRLGILCNLPAQLDAAAFKMLLRTYGLEVWFDPALVILASALPTPLPDFRAFAAAAAIAETPAGDITYLTTNPAMAAAAREAGWQVSEELLATSQPFADGLLSVMAKVTAGEIDEDTGPTFILRGRIVTMNATAQVFERGRLIISKGKIVAVLEAHQPLPAAYAQAPEVDTASTLYPGLIDLHNHLPYNIIPLWQVPRRFKNRAQWQAHPAYRPNVSMPVVALAGVESTAKSIARYVEAKAIVGGVTSGQGMKMIVSSAARYFVGAMRNVENTNDPRLPEAATSVLDLKAKLPGEVATFRKKLAKVKAYLYHLAEGVDTTSRQRFLDLQTNDLLAPSLVGIHSLGLHPEDLAALAAAGGKAVWSPLSNLLLYGQTLNLAAVQNSGITFSLGCDWCPSGSKNLLFELKVAQWVARSQQSDLLDRQLVELVTSKAAKVVGWDQHVGQLQPGMLADVLAIEGETGDPYNHLIAARERAVALVLIHGQPRYGNPDLMTQLLPAAATIEDRQIDGAAKRLYLQAANGTINDLTLQVAMDRLDSALRDLPAFIERNTRKRNDFLTISSHIEPFQLLLDMESADNPAEEQMSFVEKHVDLADAPAIHPLQLDALETDSALFWQTLTDSTNLPPGLAAAMREFYR